MIKLNKQITLLRVHTTHIEYCKGQPVNATSLPSPTMPTFNMAQTPNGQPAGAEAVYSNGIPHTYPGRKRTLCGRDN
jgi:hypothetical protein